MYEFTIIICCYNSEKRIVKTLEYIFNLEVSNKIKVEVLLVDNNSTDNTSNVALSFYKRNYKDHPFLFKVVTEMRNGLTNARIKGIEEARNEFLLFVDDDNWLSRNYLINSIKYLKNKNCLILGGLGLEVPGSKFPEWFYTIGQSGYAIGKFGRTSQTGNINYGAGMVLRKSIANKIVRKRNSLLLTDRYKNTLTSGGDSEFCYIAGLDNCYYGNDLVFYHDVGNRVNESYFIELNKSFSAAESKLIFYRINDFNFNQTLRHILLTIFNSLHIVLWIILHCKFSYFNYKVKLYYNLYFVKNLFINIFLINKYKRIVRFNLKN